MKNRIFNLYADFVCDACGILKKDLFGKSSIQLFSNARHMLFYICSQRPMKVVEIYNLCIDNQYPLTRQSIDYGIEKIKNSIDNSENKEMRILIDSCLDKFKDE